MQKPEIAAQVKKMLQERSGLPDERFADDTPLASLGIDSIHMVDIMLDLETELGFTFPDMQLPRTATVGDVVELVARSMDAGG